MGKQSGKKKRQGSNESVTKHSSASDGSAKASPKASPKAYDKDTAVFISMAQELKDEGNRLFQKRDHEGAMLKYEKAIKLLPRNHIDVSYLRSNMAACYMQMGITEYPRAIHECNLALEVTPKYSKALLKRARCYEALNRLDLALRDVTRVLSVEPNNIMALEISERVKAPLERKGLLVEDASIESLEEFVEPPGTLSPPKLSRLKSRIKRVIKNKKETEEKIDEKSEEVAEKMAGEAVVETKAEEPVGDRKAEEAAVVMKAKEPVEERKAEELVEERQAEEPVVERNAEEAAVAMKAEEPLAGRNTEEAGVAMKAEEPVEERKAEEPDEEKKSKDTEENKAVVRFEEKRGGECVEEKKFREGGEAKNGKETVEEKRTEDKLVIEKKITSVQEDEPKRNVKLVFGEDIRWALLPINCTLLQVREVIRDRFPSSKAVLIKYRDEEGDLVTITTNEELRLAETSGGSGNVRLYVVEVSPEQDPFYEMFKSRGNIFGAQQNGVAENGTLLKEKEIKFSSCIEDWIIQFAQLFKNHVGFESDTYLDLHELGMKLYSEAMEETVTSEEAQELFKMAAEKFHEMAALALFNWGNVHMASARKRVYFTEDGSKESVLAQVKSAYDWAQEEYMEAGKQYKTAVGIKPDFHEGYLALAQQQFEQAKLSWYFAIGNNVDLETWPSDEVLDLYNNAEDNMEKGMQIWEKWEEQRGSQLVKANNLKTQLQKMGLDGLFKDVSGHDAAEQAANMRSHINLLWGNMLYERSILEFKLGIPVWHECLEVAIEKFELAGASPTDMAVMIKNHCSNDSAIEGLGFRIDEIVQAWNEMYEAKKLRSGIPSFRLEPLFRRRVSKIYHLLDQA